MSVELLRKPYSDDYQLYEDGEPIGGLALSNPPENKKKIRNIFFDPETSLINIEYFDGETKTLTIEGESVVTLRLDKVSTTTTYIGEAIPGSSESDSVWRIKRMVEDGDDLQILFADGDSNFDNIWNNRASLSYS